MKKITFVILTLGFSHLMGMSPCHLPQKLDMAKVVPLEIAGEIIKYLNTKDLSRVLRVSKQWNNFRTIHTIENRIIELQLLKLSNSELKSEVFEKIVGWLSTKNKKNIIEIFYSTILKDHSIPFSKKEKIFFKLLTLPQLSEQEKNTLALMTLANNSESTSVRERFKKKIIKTFRTANQEFRRFCSLYDSSKSSLQNKKGNPLQFISEYLCTKVDDIRLMVDLFINLYYTQGCFSPIEKLEILNQISKKTEPHPLEYEKLLVVKEFLSNERPNKLGKLDLISLINIRSLQKIEQFLKIGVNPNFQMSKGSLPLLNAIRRNNLDLVKLLIKYGAQVNPTYYAAPILLSFTLEREATFLKNSKNKQTRRKKNAGSFKDIFDELLKHYNPNAIGYKSKRRQRYCSGLDFCPLHVAIDQGLYELDLYYMEKLLEAGEDINAKYRMGFKNGQMTPAMPDSYRYVTGLDIIINDYLQSDHPCSVTFSKIRTYVAFGGKVTTSSLSNMYRKIIQLQNTNNYDELNILSQKIKNIESLKLTDQFEQTLLHLACSHNNISVISFLLESKIFNINSKDISGNTPLHNAVLQNNYDICALLLSHQANTMIPNNQEKLPINIAFQNTLNPMKNCIAYKIVDLLHPHKVIKRKHEYANSYDENQLKKKAPFHKVVCNNKTSDLKELLEKKRWDLNSTDMFGNTPLHYAVLNNNYEMCRLLLEHGARSRIKNHDGKIPFDIAFQNACNPDKIGLALEIISLLDGFKQNEKEN